MSSALPNRLDERRRMVTTAEGFGGFRSSLADVGGSGFVSSGASGRSEALRCFLSRTVTTSGTSIATGFFRLGAAPPSPSAWLRPAGAADKCRSWALMPDNDDRSGSVGYWYSYALRRHSSLAGLFLYKSNDSAASFLAGIISAAILRSVIVTYWENRHQVQRRELYEKISSVGPSAAAGAAADDAGHVPGAPAG